MIELISKNLELFLLWSIIAIYIFSTWTPVNIQMFKDSPNAGSNRKDASAGGKVGFVVMEEKT